MMFKPRYLLLIGVVLVLSCVSQRHAQAKQVPVFILAGQSNMSGDGKTVDLYDPAINDDPRLTSVQEDVKVWWSTVYGSVTNHQWTAYQPNMLNPNQFGPEITLGRMLADSLGETVYFIKVAQGGSSLKRDWTPGGGGSLYMYDIFTQEVAMALQSLRNAGLSPDVRGMFWHQGETDTMSYDQAVEYETNLRGLIANARTIAGKADLPFFVGELGAIFPSSLYPYRETVVAAQNAVVTGPNPLVNTHLIETDDLGLLIEDGGGFDVGVHYDSAGYLTLGERFADAYIEAYTPEPATLCLLAVGGLMAMRRRNVR